MARGPGAALVVALALTFGVAPAVAKTRYVSPTGSGSACSSAVPCSLDTGVSLSGSGDVVVVDHGHYSISSTLTISGFSIRGASGQPRPVIDASGIDPSSTSSVSLEADSAIADLVIQNTPTGIGLYEDLAGPTHAVTVVGSSSTDECKIGPLVNDTTLIDGLVCVSSAGTGALFGVNSTFPTAVRDSVFASGGAGYSVEVGYAGGTSPSLSLTNSILAITASGQAGQIQCDDSASQASLSHDFLLLAAGPSCMAGQVTFDNASSGELVKLADLATGDVHELAGSPTINAGTHSSALDPPFDIYGDARVVGQAQDVGAAEFVLAPTAHTTAASGIARQSATINGTVTTGGAPATTHFQWGTSTAYGHVTVSRSIAANAPPGSGVSFTLRGLAPHRTYHYRLVVTTSAGTAHGVDRTLTTS